MASCKRTSFLHVTIKACNNAIRVSGKYPATGRSISRLQIVRTLSLAPEEDLACSIKKTKKMDLSEVENKFCMEKK